MTIELHISGNLFKEWKLKDIKGDYSYLGIYSCQQKIEKEIIKIRDEIRREDPYTDELIDLGLGQFYTVYQSKVNDIHVSDFELAIFNKELNIKRVDKIAEKYRLIGERSC
jgi:hypothetical protein